MKYENFKDAQSIVEQIKSLENQLVNYTSLNVSVTIENTGQKDVVWPLYGDSDGGLLKVAAKEMLGKLSKDVEDKIMALKLDLELL